MSKITGKMPTNTMVIEGKAASISLSSDANSNAFTANVLKLKGLNTKVAGSSFRISTKTNREALNVNTASAGYPEVTELMSGNQNA